MSSPGSLLPSPTLPRCWLTNWRTRWWHYGLTVNGITLWLLGGVSELGGKPPRKELHEAAEQLTASEAGLLVAGEPATEKALDNAITDAGKVVKRFVDAATGEIAEELKEALKS